MFVPCAFQFQYYQTSTLNLFNIMGLNANICTIAITQSISLSANWVTKLVGCQSELTEVNKIIRKVKYREVLIMIRPLYDENVPNSNNLIRKLNM